MEIVTKVGHLISFDKEKFVVSTGTAKWVNKAILQSLFTSVNNNRRQLEELADKISAASERNNHPEANEANSVDMDRMVQRASWLDTELDSQVALLDEGKRQYVEMYGERWEPYVAGVAAPGKRLSAQDLVAKYAKAKVAAG